LLFGALEVELGTDIDKFQVTSLFFQRLGLIMERSFTTLESRKMNQY
jgi:hypothetical protein